MFAWGTWGSGTNKGLRSDCLTAYQTGCMNLAWPGWQTSAHHKDDNPGEQEYWMGSLVDGMRDASGQIYMRNRYYDPATGQFTQQDPIGLAGGLNAYGFAAGDPVSYSDPYGLCAKDKDDREDANCRALINLLLTVAREVQPRLARGVENQFSAAAARYEGTNRRVEFVGPLDSRLNSRGQNSDSDPKTFALGRTMDDVYLLDPTAGAGDFVAAAAHEALVHEGERGSYIGDLDSRATDSAIWWQLPTRFQQTAPRWRQKVGVRDPEPLIDW
jgi:RHS repeat-associated protein